MKLFDTKTLKFYADIDILQLMAGVLAARINDASSFSAMRIAERLRAGIEAAAWDIHPVTISIGVGAYTEKVNSVIELLESADKALYAAKAAGRNCVRKAG